MAGGDTAGLILQLHQEEVLKLILCLSVRNKRLRHETDSLRGQLVRETYSESGRRR